MIIMLLVKTIMKLQILKSKLHRVTITNTHLDYEGSCAIDSEILRTAEINEYEMIHIYNLKNGERFSTYAIKAEAGSRVVTLNGCLLYTSDAADEEDSVDLGGRRIIKKKKNKKNKNEVPTNIISVSSFMTSHATNLNVTFHTHVNLNT